MGEGMVIGMGKMGFEVGDGIALYLGLGLRIGCC